MECSSTYPETNADPSNNKLTASRSTNDTCFTSSFTSPSSEAKSSPSPDEPPVAQTSVSAVQIKEEEVETSFQENLTTEAQGDSLESCRSICAGAKTNAKSHDCDISQISSGVVISQNDHAEDVSQLVGFSLCDRNASAAGRGQNLDNIEKKSVTSTLSSGTAEDGSHRSDTESSKKYLPDISTDHETETGDPIQHPDGGISFPLTANSSDKLMTVTHDEKENASNDQSDNDNTLSEEDSMSNLVITNVFSISEDDANFGEDVDGDETGSSNYEPSSQPRSVLTVNSPMHPGDSESAPSHTSENCDDFAVTAASHTATTIPDSTSSILLSSEHMQPTAGSRGRKTSDTLVLDFNELKRKSAGENLLNTGQHVREQLSTKSSASELLQAVSGLVASDRRPDSGDLLSSSEDVPSVSSLVPPVHPSSSVVPSLSPPQSAGGVLSTTVVPVVTSSGVHRNDGADGAIASALQNPAGFIREPVVSSAGDTQQLSDGGLSFQTVPKVHPVARMGETPLHPEKNMPETLKALTVKPEPADTGYENGPGVTPTSAQMSSSSSSIASTDPDADRPGSQPNSSRKRPNLELEDGREATSSSADQQKKQRVVAQASACSLSTKVQLKGKLDAVSVASVRVSFSQHTTPTAAVGGVDTTCTDGPDIVRPSPAGLDTFSTLSKPLLVPSSCTVKKTSTQLQNIPTKSVILNLPPTLSLSRTSTDQPTTSGPTGTGKKPPYSLLETVGKRSATTVTSSDQQLNEQIVTHLRHVQDKPGSQQLLMIPMPDGSTHSVKVIFAPRLKPQTSAVTTTNAPQSTSSAATTSEKGLVKTITNISSSPTAAAYNSAMPVSVSQQLGSRPNALSSTLVNYTAWKPIINQAPIQPVSRQATSLVPPSTNQIPLMGNPVPPATVIASSSQPVLSHAVLVMPVTSSSCTKPTQQAGQGASPSQPSSQGSKRDVRFDQVSAEAKLSAADMAALIQGKNFVPALEPRQRPRSLSSTSKVYRCVECGTICWTLVGYTVHVKRMSMVIRYACMVCKAALVFFNKCTFLAHLRKHTTADSATGQVLNLKSYTMSVSSLPDELLPPVEQQHMDPLVINRYQPVFCTECRKTFPDSAHLATHFGSEVKACSFEYTCTHCKMELPTSCALKAHLRLHDEESHTVCAQPDFVCPECGLCFPNQVSLYQHLFATCLHFSRCVALRCPVCSLFHPTLAVLEEHLTTFHPNQKRFQCLLCKRKYHTHFSFLHHIPQVHKSQQDRAAAEESYQMTGSCGICKSVTLEGKEHAQYHVQVVKPKAKFGYTCLFCQETPIIFEDRHQLIQHLTKSHDAYSFVCSLCEQGFVTLSLLRSHVPLAHGALQHEQKKNEQPMCLKCSAGLLGPESVVPHVMWHVMKKLTDSANQTESSQFHLNKRSMEIIAPVVHARPGDPQKRMLLCRSCGHVSSTRFSLQRHISKAEHYFCRHYAICPFCQRYDFLNKEKFEVHKNRCLTDSGVHAAIVIDDSIEDDLGQEQGAARCDDRPPQSDVGSENSSDTGAGVQPVSVSGSPGNGAATSAQSASSFTAVIQRGHVATFQKKRIIVVSQSSPLKRPANSKQTLKGKQYRVYVRPAAPGNSNTPAAPGNSNTPAGPAAQGSSSTGRAKTSSAQPSDSSKRRKTGKGEGRVESADGSITEGHEPAAMDTGRAESPPRVVFHPCHLCGLTYTSAITLANHLDSMHGGEKNVLCCKLCLKKGKEVLLSKKNLKKHLTRRHNVAKPAADAMIRDICESGPGFTEATGAEGTPRISTDSESSTSSSSEKSPVKRLRIAGGDQEYMCAKCGFSSPNTSEFRDHIMTHAVENCVQCLECGLCFSAISSLNKHLFMVHKVKEPAAYIEQHNIKLEELPKDLASHMDTLAPLGEPEVKINTTAVYHDALHTAKPYREDWKEKRPRKSEDGDESLLECNVCYKEFENDIALRSHMRTHGMAFIRSRRVSRQLAGQKIVQSGEEKKGKDLEDEKQVSEISTKMKYF